MSDIIHVCKKCGTELPTNYKHKKCEYCRRENIASLKRSIKSIVPVFIAGFLVGSAVGKNNKDNKSDTDDQNDETE